MSVVGIGDRDVAGNCSLVVLSPLSVRLNSTVLPGLHHVANLHALWAALRDHLDAFWPLTALAVFVFA